MIRLFSFVVVLAVFAAGCGDADDTGTGDTRPSVAGEWVLETLIVDGAEVPRPDGAIEMTIADSSINGNLGCNSFFGVVEAADDGSVVIGPLGQTEMACMDDGRMEFESTYGQALGSVTAWAVDPAGLTLSSATAEIRYSQAPPPVYRSLEGTVWNFDTIYAGQAVTNRADMDGVTLVIESGKATIDGPGCPATSASVEFDDGSEGSFAVGERGFDVGDSGDCGPVIDVADGLTAATGFMIDEDRLTFVGDAGETIGFHAEPAS